MGMLWMLPTGWPDHLLKAMWPGRTALTQGSLAARMRKFTLLDDAMRGIAGAAAGGWRSEIGRRQGLAGTHGPGGGRRHLFGVGGGPTKAAAEAKQETPVIDNGSTQAGVRNKMRNNDLRFGYGHASVTLRSAS